MRYFIPSPKIIGLLFPFFLLSGCDRTPFSSEWTAEQQKALQQASLLFSKGTLQNKPDYKSESGAFSPSDIQKATSSYLNTVQAKQFLKEDEYQYVIDVERFHRWNKVFNGKDDDFPITIVKKINHARQKQGLPVITSNANFAAVVGAMAELKDAHTHYVSPAISENFNQTVFQYAKGIGADLKETKEGAQIIALKSKGPLRQVSGVAIGQYIVGYSLKKPGKWVEYPFKLDAFSLDMEKALDQTVWLKIKSENKVFEVKITPKKFNDNEEAIQITKDFLTPTTPVTRLSFSFLYNEGTASPSVAQDLKKILAENPNDDYILDFRQCRGGSVEMATEVASLLSSSPVVFKLQDKHLKIKDILNSSTDFHYKKPFQFWIGPRTISACEMVVQSVLDTNPEARALGWNTFGKGTIQHRIPLGSADSGLGEAWITVFEVLSPQTGESLQAYGATPGCKFKGDPSLSAGERAYPNHIKPYTAPHYSMQPMEPSLSAPQWDDQREAALLVWKRAALKVKLGECRFVAQSAQEPTNPIKSAPRSLAIKTKKP